MHQNHYKSIVLDLRRQKELDAALKAIQQVELLGKLKTRDGVNDDGTRSGCFNYFWKNQTNETKVLSGKGNSLTNYKRQQIMKNQELNYQMQVLTS